MFRLLSATILAICSIPLFSQTDTGAGVIHLIYRQEIDPNQLIYRGKQFYAFDASIDGHPFFKTEEWQKSTFTYKGNIYRAITARFDLVNQELIVTHEGIAHPVRLESNWLNDFALDDACFIHITEPVNENMKSGFYEVLLRDSISLLAFHEKYIRKNPTPTKLEQWFASTNKFYIQKGNNLIEVNRTRDLIKTFRPLKSEIKAFLNENNLDVRKETETSLLAVVRYLNQLYRK